MDLSNLSSYLVFVVVGICLCVGYVIKTSIPQIKNQYIPLIMAVLGLVINVCVNDFQINADVILAGLFSGLASTGLHQAFSQIINNEKGETE